MDIVPAPPQINLSNLSASHGGITQLVTEEELKELGHC